MKKMNIFSRQITIIGAERSGIGAARLVKRLGGKPFVSDFAEADKLATSIEVLEAERIPYETGGHTEKAYQCEWMVLSPGVPSDADVITTAKQRGVNVISEIEFASMHCKANIIAITGTNGKTTTTTLLAHILRAAGKEAYTAGNIGRAFSDIAVDLSANAFVSLEVSSFQLDFIDAFKPEVSMVLNITPDHLNRYDNNYDNYIASKKRIFKNQNGTDLVILNADDQVLREATNEVHSKIMQFSLKKSLENGASFDGTAITCRENGKITFQIPVSTLSKSLTGEHNIANAMAAVIAAKWAGAENDLIVKGLETFAGVEHRLEELQPVRGLRFVNDSKATNVDSVWYALRSYPKNIVLILGGLDKGNDYDKIKEPVTERVKKIYAIGNSAGIVDDYFSSFKTVERKADLEDCVRSFLEEGEEGDILLLSPACASFDMFRSYEHRGEVFKQAVRDLAL